MTRSRATRSREIKLNDITRRVKNLSRKICELSKLLFVACRGSYAPLLRLGCQNLTKEKEKKKRRRRGSRGSSNRQPEWRRKIPVEIPVEDAPATLKSFVWQHFGYPAEIMNGSRVTDKTRTISSCQWHTWSDSVCTICTLYWWSRTLIWFRR